MFQLKTPVKQPEQTDTGGFFSMHNTELDEEKRFYKAILESHNKCKPAKL